MFHCSLNPFTEPLPVFNFTKADGMRLWVLPFCIDEDLLKLPMFPKLQSIFVDKVSHSKQPDDFNVAQIKSV